jgi:signal transduction histidine kinase/ligand-binding sensor domain-containing protein
MKIKLILLFLLYLSGLTKAFSQTRSNYINFEIIDVESGLSQNYVNCIFQDYDGFIWIGTEDGLNRYDGVNFIKYYKDNKIENSISGSRITGIVEDRNNCLWISTKNNGLNKLSFDRKIFTTYFNDSQQSNYVPKISNLKYDGNNKIWFTSNNKIYSFDIRSEKLQNIGLEIDSNFVISDFIIDGENDVWISSNKNFFFRYDAEKNKISNPYYLSNSVLITTLYKFENKIIIGTLEGEIFIYEPEKDKCESIFKSVVLNDNKNFLFGKDTSKFAFTAFDICADNENKILISGLEALLSLKFFIDSLGNEKLATVYSVTDFGAHNIISDKSGNIWLGTNGTGIRIYNEKFKKFKANYNFDNFESLTNIKSIRTISENTDYLFVGGYFGLVFINKNNFESTNFITEVRKNNPNVFYNPKGIQFEPSIYCILPDPDKPDEIIWIGVEDYCSGLYKYNLNTKKITHFVMNKNTNDFTANFVFDICNDAYGNLWIANKYGAYKFSRETLEFTYFQNNPDDPNSIQAGKISTIYKDSKNVLWFGSVNDGISYYEESTGNFIHLREHKNDTNAIQSNGIISIYQDKKQNYWFGSSGEGLTKYDFENNRFVNYTVSDGLPNNVIYGILEDDNGCLWLSTNNGISKFDTATEEFTNFSVSDGLLNIEYNTAAYYKSKDGTMFFGGINGFDYFKPDEIYTNDYQAPIKITSIKINNIEIQPDSALSSLKILDLSYSDNIFSVEFAALSYFQSAQNEYAYMLEGINSDWVNLGNTNAITFNGLKPGSYILKIKASNNDGLWNEEVFELPIVVHPPFWEEWWFVVSIFVVMLIIGAIIFRIRKIQFQKKKNELESIISDRTFKIQHQKEELQQSVESLEKALDMVNTLSKTKDDMSSMLVHDLKNPLNSIINYSRLIPKSENKYRPELIEKTNDIEKSALDMLSLVNNLMDISKMEEAKMTLNVIENSLNKAIEKAFLQIKFSLSDKKLTLENRILQNITAEFDYDLIVRVLVNLLSNAIKFSENNSRIIIDYEIIGREIKIKITDFGEGIPQEHTEDIFNKFVQHKIRKLGVSRSTGLGLTFSKLVLEAHNQQIGVISQVGEGSTFWFSMKLLSSNSPGKSKPSDEYTQNLVLSLNEEIIECKKKLQSLKFFQTGEIFSALSGSNFSSNEFLDWKKEVEKAVLYTNDKYYNELIKL